MRSPELPDGSVFWSSACAWITSDVPPAVKSDGPSSPRVTSLIDDGPVRSAVRLHCEVVHVAGVRPFRILQAVHLRVRIEVCAGRFESRTFTFRDLMEMDRVLSRRQVLKVQFKLNVFVVRHWLDRYGADTFSGSRSSAQP